MNRRNRGNRILVVSNPIQGNSLARTVLTNDSEILK